MELILITILLLIIEIKFKPRLDTTKHGKLLLWYGKINRKYYILF